MKKAFRGDFCVYNSVVFFTSIPPILLSVSTLLIDNNRGCSSDTWLATNDVLCLVNILAAIYISNEIEHVDEEETAPSYYAQQEQRQRQETQRQPKRGRASATEQEDYIEAVVIDPGDMPIVDPGTIPIAEPVPMNELLDEEHARQEQLTEPLIPLEEGRARPKKKAKLKTLLKAKLKLKEKSKDKKKRKQNRRQEERSSLYRPPPPPPSAPPLQPRQAIVHSRLTENTDNENPSAGSRNRLKNVLCRDRWVTVYKVFLFAFIMWQFLGAYILLESPRCGRRRSGGGVMELSVRFGIAFIGLGGIAFASSICCAVSRRNFRRN